MQIHKNIVATMLFIAMNVCLLKKAKIAEYKSMFLSASFYGNKN